MKKRFSELDRMEYFFYFVEGIGALHFQKINDNQAMDSHLKIWTFDPDTIVETFD